MITEKKFLTEKELDALKKKLDEGGNERDKLLILSALYTGARRNEILNVRPCDLGENSITIYGLKGSNDRTIPIFDDAYWQSLKAFISINKIEEHCPIFNITPRHFNRIFKTYSEKSVKALRHTMGVNFYKASRDIKANQHILGHKNIQNTIVYMDFVESQESIRDKLGKVFGK